MWYGKVMTTHKHYYSGNVFILLKYLLCNAEFVFFKLYNIYVAKFIS